MDGLAFGIVVILATTASGTASVAPRGAADATTSTAPSRAVTPAERRRTATAYENALAAAAKALRRGDVATARRSVEDASRVAASGDDARPGSVTRAFLSTYEGLATSAPEPHALAAACRGLRAAVGWEGTRAERALVRAAIDLAMDALYAAAQDVDPVVAARAAHQFWVLTVLSGDGPGARHRRLIERFGPPTDLDEAL